MPGNCSSSLWISIITLPLRKWRSSTKSVWNLTTDLKKNYLSLLFRGWFYFETFNISYLVLQWLHKSRVEELHKHLGTMVWLPLYKFNHQSVPYLPQFIKIFLYDIFGYPLTLKTIMIGNEEIANADSKYSDLISEKSEGILYSNDNWTKISWHFNFNIHAVSSFKKLFNK